MTARKHGWIMLAIGVIFGAVVGFEVATLLVFRYEVAPLRARLAHYQEVTHTTPPLCVEGEVSP